MSLALASQAKICTWTNGVGDLTGNWSVPGNWTNNPAFPVSGDSLVFGPTTGTTMLTNDIVFTSCGSITFSSDAPAYTMNGNPLSSGGAATLGGFIVNSGSSITQTINLNLGTLWQNAFNVSGNGNLTLGGSCGKGGTWNPNLTMNGTGVLTLNGAPGFGAPYLTVNTGTVVLAKTVVAGVGSSITINNGGLVILGSSNQVSGTLTMSAGATFDLNGYDNGSMIAPNQSGFFQINGAGGLIVNNAAGTGTNTLQLGGMNLAGSLGAFGGRIMDGPSAKTALGLGYNCWNSVFQMLTGNNTYSGGTTFGPISQTSTYTGGATLSISSMQNIGAAGSRKLTFSGPASFVSHSVLLITGTEITDLSGFDSVIFNPGTRVGFDIADPSNTFTLGQAVNNGTGGTFLKRGAGTLVLTNAATYTGATSIEGGTLKVDYQAGGSLNSATAPTISGGNLFLRGKNSGPTSQTLSALTVSTGGGNLLIDPNNGDSTKLTLGGLTTTAAGGNLALGRALNAGSGAVTNTTTTNKKGDGTYGGRVIIASGTANTGYDFATTLTGSPYVLSAYTAAAELPASVGSSTTNYKMTNNTAMAGNVAANSLKLEAPTGYLALGANLLTITSGGLLSTGTSAVQITGDTGVVGLTAGNGSGTYDLIVHQYNGGGLTINAVIGNNGASAVALVKAGTETLTLAGTNTYTGATYVNGGKLAIAANNQLGAEATGASVTLYGGTLATTGSFTLDNAGANKRAINTGAGGGGIEVGSGTLTVSGVVGGSGILTKSGAGVLLLSGANTCYGGVKISDGMLSVSSDGNLGRSGFGVTFAGGTLQITGTTLTSLSSRNVNWATFNGGLDITNSGNTFALTNALGTGTILTKTGAGKLSLTGPQAGTINTDDPSKISFGSGLNFYNLGLTSGGVLSPAGSGTNGTVAVNNNFTLAGKLLADVTASTNDTVTAGVTITLSPGATLELVNPSLLERSKNYTLMTAGGAVSGTLTALNLPLYWKVTASGNTVVLYYVNPGTMISIF
jgi:autotransporter-associated beta strand protein